MVRVKPVLKKRERCAEITDLIAAYLTGELDAATKRAFENHMARCPDCVSFLNTYKKTLHSIHSIEHETIPDAMLKRVESFLNKKVKGRRGR